MGAFERTPVVRRAIGLFGRTPVVRRAMTEREEAGLGRAERRIESEIGLHQMMRSAVKLDLLQRPPAEPLEQERVLALDMGEEAPATQRMRRRDGETDQ